MTPTMRLPTALRRISPHPAYPSHHKIALPVRSRPRDSGGCAQVRKVRHQCRCDTSTARILSDAQPLFGRYEYERPNVLEGASSLGASAGICLYWRAKVQTKPPVRMRTSPTPCPGGMVAKLPLLKIVFKISANFARQSSGFSTSIRINFQIHQPSAT